MIPVAVPSVAGILLLLLSCLTGLWLIGWLLLLAFSKRARRRLSNRPRRGIALLVVLALLSTPGYVLQYGLFSLRHEHAKRQAALRVTLPQAQAVAGVNMPAGTRLALQVEGELDTFVLAEFDPPADAYGVQATRIERYLSADYDDHYNVVRRYPGIVHVWGKGVQKVSGWQCDTAKKLTFAAKDKGDHIDFRECTLAEGNRVGDVPLPAGAEVQARSSSRAAQAQAEPVDWTVSLYGRQPLKVAGLWLGNLALRVDDNRARMAVSYGVLACPLKLGRIHYPAQTQVRQAGTLLRDETPDAWIFTPDLGMRAERDDGTAVTEGSSILQRLDGTELEVLSNEQLMIGLFPKLVVDGVVTPGPVDCPQEAG